MAALAGKCQQIFMAAVFAFHTGKAVMQIAAIEIAIDHLLDIGPPEAVLPGEILIIDSGVDEFTVSIESNINELSDFMRTCEVPLEIIIHGPLKVMYTDHNLYENVSAFAPVEKNDNKYVGNNILVLMTDKGENPVYLDHNSRNHIFTAKELCLLPILGGFNFKTPLSFRIEGQTYTPEELKSIITVYKSAIADKSRCRDLFFNLKSFRAGFTLGALSF